MLLIAVLPNLGGDSATEADAGPGGGPGPASDGDWAPASGDIEVGTGTARSGVECEPGVGQIPDTVYAVPCVAEFEGDNGGETFRGVTADTIRIAVRSFPDTANSAAVEAETQAAGFATEEVAAEIADQFAEYLNEHYELYGRRVEFVEYESQFSNSTQEALGQGREGACQDATQIVEELDAFGVLADTGATISSVFAECAAERELVVFQGAGYYPEEFYEELHPYVWHTVASCDQLNEHRAAYIGTRLADRPAARASDPALHDQTRRFGVYVPDNPQYVGCSDELIEALEREHGVEGVERVTYALDVSRFAEQAARAVVQWKAAGVTTVVLAADPISVGMLTTAATDQDYGPEWIITGSSGMDTDNFGRSYDQEQVDGHMFGLSQISASENIYGPESEPGRLYEKLNGEEIPAGTTADFYDLVPMFNFLQAAGPELTPENMAAGVQSMPAMGGDGRPIWSYEGDHTATEDSREVYWDGSAPPGPDEPDRSLRGSFVQTYDGRRFLPDEWPAEEPPVYPDR